MPLMANVGEQIGTWRPPAGDGPAPGPRGKFVDGLDLLMSWGWPRRAKAPLTCGFAVSEGSRQEEPLPEG